jgi:hypothetical protein
MKLVPRALQGVLHKVVGARAIAGQRARVSAQARNELDDPLAIIHGADYDPAPERKASLAGETALPG